MYNFIEFCAGAGGLSSGLIKSGLTPLLLNDNNKDACRTLIKNHKNCNVQQLDMTKFNLDELYNKYKNIDLIAGGVPCQSFSYAGKKKGLDDSRGELIIDFLKIINLLQPKIFLIENVKGLLTHKKGDTINEIMKSYDIDSKYTVQFKILNSFDYQVPQKRERLFIIGVNNKYKNVKFNYPERIKEKIVLKDVLYDVPKSLCAKYNSTKIELFKLIPQGQNWKSLSIEQQKNYLGKSFYAGGGKTGILKRLSMDEPSLTILCSPAQKQTERCHPLYERPLSIRESARIQTFDDDYEFIGSLTSQYKQIGNSVPVKLAYYVGLEIINTLKQISKINKIQ